MKRLFTTALACAFAVSLAVPMSAQDDPATMDQPAAQEPAQDPAPAPEPAPAPSDDAVGTSGTADDTQAASADSITVTGCLSGSEDNWQLTDAKKSDEGESSSMGSTAGTAGSADAGATYALKGANNDELKAHVGHKIEVTGTLDESSSMASSDPASTGDQAVGTAGAGAADAKKLNVTSVKMVSGSCE